MPDITQALSDSFLRSNALDPLDDGLKTYTISQLAKEFDITTRAIRFYESEGLLTPEREGRSRLYSQRDHTRLKLILRGKRVTFRCLVVVVASSSPVKSKSCMPMV